MSNLNTNRHKCHYLKQIVNVNPQMLHFLLTKKKFNKLMSASIINLFNRQKTFKTTTIKKPNPIN